MTPRQCAAEYRAQNPNLPQGGYIVLYRCEAVGWTASIAETNGWLDGCTAVPAYHNSLMYKATGGDYQHGAERWEPMDPKYEAIPSE